MTGGGWDRSGGRGARLERRGGEERSGKGLVVGSELFFMPLTIMRCRIWNLEFGFWKEYVYI